MDWWKKKGINGEIVLSLERENCDPKDGSYDFFPFDFDIISSLFSLPSYISLVHPLLFYSCLFFSLWTILEGEILLLMPSAVSADFSSFPKIILPSLLPTQLTSTPITTSSPLFTSFPSFLYSFHGSNGVISTLVLSSLPFKAR